MRCMVKTMMKGLEHSSIGVDGFNYKKTRWKGKNVKFVHPRHLIPCSPPGRLPHCPANA
jgi:hypothetical protein